MPEFKYDDRKKNPGLHMLHTKWAVKHLTLIDDMIERLGDESNLNLHDIIDVMCKERGKLVATNAAYADADDILHERKNGHL